MGDNEEICIICDAQIKPTDEYRGVSGDLLKKYIQASIQRADGKHRLFKCLHNFWAHANCCKHYTAEEQIKRAQRKNSLKPTSKPLLRSEKQFDFQNLCFFCSNDASEDFISKQLKKSENSRITVRFVKSDGKLQKNILEHGKNLFDLRTKEVIDRISRVENLHPQKARYHDKCYLEFCAKLKKKPEELADTPELKAAKFVSDYLLQNPDECQVCLEVILENYEGDKSYDMDELVESLRSIHGESFVCFKSKYGTYLTMKSFGEKFLSKKWYTDDRIKNDEDQERKRIVATAAEILLEEVRAQECDTDHYSFSESKESEVPELLLTFLRKIVKKYKKDSEDVDECDDKINAIAHGIVAATRPNSFVSSLQVGLATFLKREFGSESLVGILNSLGVCVSNEEVELFEKSLANAEQEVNFTAEGMCVPVESGTKKEKIERLKEALKKVVIEEMVTDTVDNESDAEVEEEEGGAAAKKPKLD